LVQHTTVPDIVTAHKAFSMEGLKGFRWHFVPTQPFVLHVILHFTCKWYHSLHSRE
jgi:hypothetical protein